MTGCFKKAGKKVAPGHSGHRFHKVVGLGFKTPKSAIEGATCAGGLGPDHGLCQVPGCVSSLPCTTGADPGAGRPMHTGAFIDKKCPFTGDVSIRGRLLTGAWQLGLAAGSHGWLGACAAKRVQ